MKSQEVGRFLDFLQNELAIPETDLRLVLRKSPRATNLIAMELWHYGLVTLTQLNQIFDWLDRPIVT